MKSKISTLVSNIHADTKIPDQQKKEIVEAINRNAEALPDTGIYRILIGMLSIIVIAFVICGTIIIVNQKDANIELPEFLVGGIGTILGALLGLFVPSPSSK